MRTTLALLLAAMLLPPITSTSRAAASASDTLSFEVAGPDGGLGGWYGNPPGTVFRDSTTVHGGRYAARFERGADARSNFSAITRVIPLTFSGDSLELRGWLKTSDVVGFAGLWLREDGDGASANSTTCRIARSPERRLGRNTA